jgi:predicted pyridoxine 5'-phosphate oxidase superfamily flavin-nucleotide-binding protein
MGNGLMARAFTEITFTSSVKAAQARYGSLTANQSFEQAEDPRNLLTDREAEFIAGRDNFYQASVSETGWPYVQFRGGPKGFLKVLDERTIGYADFRGNVQYRQHQCGRARLFDSDGLPEPAASQNLDPSSDRARE